MFHAFNISSSLGLRLKVDEHSMQWTKIMLIWQILLLQQAKHWCCVLSKKVCFCKFQLSRFFFSASIECQQAILVDCIDQSKCNLQKMVSCLCDLLFSLSYCYKESTLRDTIPKLVLLPWQQDTQTSLCLSSFIATSVMMLVLSNLVAFSCQRSFWLSSPLKMRCMVWKKHVKSAF